MASVVGGVLITLEEFGFVFRTHGKKAEWN